MRKGAVTERVRILRRRKNASELKPDSDIDIMILVDLAEQEILERGRMLSQVTFEYDFEFDLAIMPIVKNIDHFNKWCCSYPFYYNVKIEGVELYAA